MLHKALVAISLCVIIGGAFAGQSPVFLWGASSATKPALQTVETNEFAELLAPLLKDHMVVAYQEEDLSASDFLCANGANSKSCYAHLRSVGPKTYYASVESPAEALRAIATDREFNTVASKTRKLATPIACAPGKVVFVNFEQDEQERTLNLEAHDAAIAAVGQELASCPTVYLYMASPSSSVAKSRSRRDVDSSTGGVYFRSGSQFLIYFTTLSLYNSETNSAEPITISGMSVSNSSANMISVSLAGSNNKDVTFDITKGADGYFQMSNVKYNGISFRSSAVNAPTTFSYACGNLTLEGAGTEDQSSVYSLLWNSLQLQAPFGSTNDPNFKFGDAWSCLSFFSPGILMGLLVAFLFLGIMFTGVAWMMDMNTMDRFDDPKGKTITVNVSE